MMSSMPLECWLFTFHVHLLVFLSFLLRACLFWEERRLIFCVIQANCLQSAAFKRVSANGFNQWFLDPFRNLVSSTSNLSFIILPWVKFSENVICTRAGGGGPGQNNICTLKSSCLNCVEENTSGIKPSSFWSCCLCCSCIGLYHYITTI